MMPLLKKEALRGFFLYPEMIAFPMQCRTLAATKTQAQ
jgi:hypothetical protein